MPRSDPGISAIVIARDEEDGIERCLRSVAWADERIVVVDSATRDSTAERARPLATDVVIRPWEGFVAAKRFAVERSSRSWILWLDADEAVDPELADAIRSAVVRADGAAGFRLRRRNHYMGRVVSHGAWSGDSVLRLFARDRARWVDRLVHEEVEVDGRVENLPGHLDHWSYRDLGHHLEKIGSWAGLWAEQSINEGRRAGVHDLLLRPPIRFAKGYILKGGFLDGVAGLVLAFMDSVYVGSKYARLLEVQRARRGKGER
jgi:glycosyltransferase involved in cell wall biosynthesis